VSVDLDVVWKDLLAACGEVGAGETAGEAGASAPGEAPDGPAPAFVARPGSTEEAAAVMRVAAEHELAVVVRGGGSRLSWGIPAARCDLVIDTSRMSGVVEHASGDLVAKVRAGARMGDVQAVLAQAGQEIALDVPGDASVGGVIGSGLAGPRRLRYGTPRDLLIGMTIVRADGTIAKSGGKVVKNVAGYDLGKLFAGSAGTLGLITEAIFRQRRTHRSSPPPLNCPALRQAGPSRSASCSRGRPTGSRRALSGWPDCLATARSRTRRRPGGRVRRGPGPGKR
jgi:glycolate oxidase FAD binding subunit